MDRGVQAGCHVREKPAAQPAICIRERNALGKGKVASVGFAKHLHHDGNLVSTGHRELVVWVDAGFLACFDVADKDADLTREAGGNLRQSLPQNSAALARRLLAQRRRHENHADQKGQCGHAYPIAVHRFRTPNEFRLALRGQGEPAGPARSSEHLMWILERAAIH